MDILPSTTLSTNHKSADQSKFTAMMSLVERKWRRSKFPSHRHKTVRWKAGKNFFMGLGLITWVIILGLSISMIRTFVYFFSQDNVSAFILTEYFSHNQHSITLAAEMFGVTSHFTIVKWLQEKWACDFHDNAKPLSFQLQV